MNSSPNSRVSHVMNAGFKALLLISTLANLGASAPAFSSAAAPVVAQSGKPDGGQGGQKKKKKNEEEREEERARATRATLPSSSAAV